GDVKVLDFGVARAAFAGREARTERVRSGSLGSMAPERLLGEPDTAAGDVYALGVMLYELLATKLYGRAELGVDRQLAQVAAARAAMVEVLGEASPVVPLIERCLAYAPDDRPNARDLADALRALAPALPGDDLVRFARDVLPRIAATPSHEGVRGTVLEESGPRTETGARVSSATLVYDPDAPPSEDPASDDPFATEPAPAKRPAWAAVGIGLVVVLLVGIGTAFALRGDADAPPPPPADLARGAAAAEPAPAPAPDAEPPVPAEPPAVAPASETPAVADAAPSAPAAPSTGARAPAAKKPAAAAPPESAAVTPAPPESAAVTSAPTAPTAPALRLRAAKFTLTGAEGIAVTCGDVTGTGATSTLLREFPAGECVVTAAGRAARVRLDTPRGVACAVDGDTLTCR
ncbi:MAG: protein kinase domain-containing protein, partial [Myxococcota bacterium]